jgi:hypothetical protein
MYSDWDFESKRALKEAVATAGPSGVGCHQPGPFGPSVADGDHCCEGPHYPEPHRWYARVRVKGGRIVKVLG